MGYRVSCVNKIPKIPGIELYAFVVGDIEWDIGFAQKIMDNFSQLARKLGESGAIIAPHDGLDLTEELSENVNRLAHKNKDVQDFLSNSHRNGVGLLLMSAHPDDLNQYDLLIYSPLELLEQRFGTLEQFFNELCEFAKTKDESFKAKFIDSKSGLVSETADMVDLKPNIFGIGINLNPIKDKLLSKIR
tara:strand:- start:67 stop:633 length:567 start_codon:yes stop_codon:yes gene_type:complete